MAPFPSHSYHRFPCNIARDGYRNNLKFRIALETVVGRLRLLVSSLGGVAQDNGPFSNLPFMTAVPSPTASNLRVQPALGCSWEYPHLLYVCASTSMPHYQCLRVEKFAFTFTQR